MSSPLRFILPAAAALGAGAGGALFTRGGTPAPDTAATAQVAVPDLRREPFAPLKGEREREEPAEFSLLPPFEANPAGHREAVRTILRNLLKRVEELEEDRRDADAKLTLLQRLLARRSLEESLRAEGFRPFTGGADAGFDAAVHGPGDPAGGGEGLLFPALPPPPPPLPDEKP